MAPEQVLEIDEPKIGLRAVIVLDSTRLGPAAGGVRTARYASIEDATAEAAALARSMTIKCSLAGLDAGGAKAVIIEQEDWDRSAGDRATAFRRFGEIVQGLGGQFRTAGDLGTSEQDLLAMASSCEYIHTKERELSHAVALGLTGCLQALAKAKGRELQNLRLAVQGCGAIGAAVIRELSGRVAELCISDLREERAASLAEECGAKRIALGSLISAEVDILSPCATGGVLHAANIDTLRAWGLCGGANLVIADRATEQALFEAGVLVVPDWLASAGAVIEGIGKTVMGLSAGERRGLIDALSTTASNVLETSKQETISAQAAAESLAMERLR